MGRMQREKGKRFERAIAAELRKHWPSAVVRRASQAERADNPDVFVEGGPVIAGELWLELQDARMPTPLKKLVQAEADVLAWQQRRGLGVDYVRHRRPVVVWHKIAEREIWVTLRLGALLDIVEPNPARTHRLGTPVTLAFPRFLTLLAHAGGAA